MIYKLIGAAWFNIIVRIPGSKIEDDDKVFIILFFLHKFLLLEIIKNCQNFQNKSKPLYLLWKWYYKGVYILLKKWAMVCIMICIILIF